MVTKKARAQQRKRVATFARKHGVTSAAAEFEVSPTTVRVACKEHGVTPARSAEVSYELLARLINTDDPFKTIAEDEGTTPQAISKIATKCRAAGIKLKPRKRGG